MSNLSNIISSFDSAEDLEQWARVHDLTQDQRVIERLQQLRTAAARPTVSRRTCPDCDKSFSSNSTLNRHIRSTHEACNRFRCGNCEKSYKYKTTLDKHRCSGLTTDYRCRSCPQTFATTVELCRHRQWKHSSDNEVTSSATKGDSVRRENPPVQNGSKSSRKTGAASATTRRPEERRDLVSCRQCRALFRDHITLYEHQIREGHRRLPQVGDGSGPPQNLQDQPWGNASAPWEDDTGQVTNPELQRAYNLNAPHILAPHRSSNVISSFNFPTSNDVTVSDLMDRVRHIYYQQNHAFRMNLAFGVILRNVETGRYRYFHPYAVDPLFSRPIYVSNRQALVHLQGELESMDIISHLLKHRPDTKWKPILIANVNFFVYRTGFPLGYTPSPLPDYIKSHKAIISLEYNVNTALPYNDHLCIFRCLALHRDPGASKRLETATKRLYLQWVVYCRDHDLEVLDQVLPKNYPGLTLSNLPHFESCFSINVNIFNLNELKIAQPVFKSHTRFGEQMNLNLHDHHLSYITNINLYCKRYQCSTCEKLFCRFDNCKRHQRSCKGQTAFKYPGGFHHTPKHIFEELEEYGIHVDQAERFFPWFIVYDFESLLKRVDHQSDGEKLVWTQEHQAISVSLCSNVEGFTIPRCFVNDDQEELLTSMLSFMSEIASAVETLAFEKWGTALNELHDRLSQLAADNGEASKAEELLRNCLSNLYGRLKGYCSQVPVLGYNSARYDLNVVKEKLARFLSMHDPNCHGFTVKKNNAYICQSSDKFKFMDITQYLAAGTSYAQFLKAYGVRESKGFFPYEYLDCASKLEETRLPPLGEAWFSRLRQKSVLDDGLKTPEENYAWLEEVWDRENMSTFRDFLMWYNNLDVGPFVEAVGRLQNFYFEEGLDIFKTTMSVPGIARQKLFATSKEKGATFALFDENNKDLFETVKRNVTGGPSLIFTRYHKAGVTRIRENPNKPCRRLVGYDANALYLWAIDQAMPTGPFIRRRASKGFKPEVRDKYMVMFYWMDWLRQTEGVDIRHKLNWGHEKRIGPYLVDGFIPKTKTIFSFHGCYYHGHDCRLTTSARGKDKSRKLLEERFERTVSRRSFLEWSGYKVEEIWECQFEDLCRNTPELRSFIHARRPTFYRCHKWKVSERQILRAVENGELFGMVEVDIRVPEQWSPDKRPYNTTFTPYQYFEEMSPLFCNAEIPFEAIGEHMQQYVREHGLSEKPRKLLVGGLRGRKLLIATPLLQWYLQHGMIVDRVYQVVEYTPMACFQGFVEKVSSARREADLDPSKSIRGDTYKLEGNSAFGSLLIDKMKHVSVMYVEGQVSACRQVNQPQFRKLTELEDDYFEVEKAKKTIRLDTPIQLGYFILQYAKLRMLQFYYDFMDVFVDRSDFEYCEMDTDSAYMAISAQRLSDIIKPDFKPDFEQGLKSYCRSNVTVDAEHRWFPRTCCEQHTRYDKRTPGLFKLEFEGDEMIGLCSKTYLVSNNGFVHFSKPSPTSLEIAARRLSRLARKPKMNKASKRRAQKTCRLGKLQRTIKFSCKGISKRTVKSPLAVYRKVLRNRIAGCGMNRGFRVKQNKVFTYEQTRHGLSYFYCKRLVHDDGIHTSPLDVDLSPWPSQTETLDDTDTFLIDFLNSNA